MPTLEELTDHQRARLHADRARQELITSPIPNTHIALVHAVLALDARLEGIGRQLADALDHLGIAP
jgi:hypothetical protein